MFGCRFPINTAFTNENTRLQLIIIPYFLHSFNMCCIKYEEEAYLDLSKKLPKVGDEGTTEDGHHCVVDSINILKQRIRVIVDLDDDEREAREYGPGDIKFTRRKKKNNNKSNEQEVSAEEMKALKELEKE